MALQMQISCFSPELRLAPFSVISMSNPLYCGSLSKSYSSWAAFITCKILSSLTRFSGSKLNRRVPVNMVASWGITVMRFLTSLIGSLEMSTPSISIEPEKSSIILLKDKQIVLLPAPVRPTTPIFSPDLTSNVRSLSTFSVLGRYFRVT